MLKKSKKYAIIFVLIKREEGGYAFYFTYIYVFISSDKYVCLRSRRKKQKADMLGGNIYSVSFALKHTLSFEYAISALPYSVLLFCNKAS